MSLLLGDNALNMFPVEEDGEEDPSIEVLEHDSCGGDIFGGVCEPEYCSCFLRCIRRISIPRLAAICSTIEKESINYILFEHYIYQYRNNTDMTDIYFTWIWKIYSYV